MDDRPGTNAVAPDRAGAGPSLADLAIWPTVAFCYALVVLQLSGLDEWVLGFFFDSSRRMFPLKNDFWTSTVLHTGGRRFMVTVALAILAAWLLSFRLERLRAWRKLLGYLVVSLSLSVMLVNLGKAVSNMDCPWDLIEYGGLRTHFGLFQDKPDKLPIGRCFPGGHSSGGFSLFALFFVARRRGCRCAGRALAPALLVGGLFAFDQWMRGAHFPSHDLTTAYLCWMIALGVYAVLFRKDERAVASARSTVVADAV